MQLDMKVLKGANVFSYCQRKTSKLSTFLLCSPSWGLLDSPQTESLTTVLRLESGCVLITFWPTLKLVPSGVLWNVKKVSCPCTVRIVFVVIYRVKCLV